MNNLPPLYKVIEMTDADYLHAVREYELYIAAKRHREVVLAAARAELDELPMLLRKQASAFL